MQNKLKKTLFFIFALFIAAGSARAEENALLELDKVSIPKKLGKVREVYQAPVIGRTSQKVIFHIQDVHANYEAQKNMADILEHLIMTYGISVILVEGGITDKDFSYIRDWASLEERKKKAGELLKEGIISGETYVDIASDFPLKFQGIEDQKLYEANMEAYLEIGVFRSKALLVLSDFKNTADKLKKFIYTRRLKEFDNKNSKYVAQKMELIDYLNYLDEIALKEVMSLKKYRNFNIIVETSRLEKKIDFKKAERERDILISDLSKRLPKKELKVMIAKSLDFKKGDYSPSEFYSYLWFLAVENKLKLRKYRNLDKYTDYIAIYEALNREELFDEIEDIEEAISDSLCGNLEQETLFMISKNLSILEEFLNLKFIPDDFDYYRVHKKEFDFDKWKSFLLHHAKRFRIKADLDKDTSLITDNLNTLEGFYALAFERDEAFIRNSLKKMNKEKEDLAVLIAGGFHTKNLSRLFMNSNISYLIITPQVTKKTDDLLYDRILKESYETRTWDKD